MNEKTTETMLFRMPRERSTASEVLISVYESMREKGYDPINQIVGYLISGDPTYITSYNNARYRICSLQRDELVEELVRFYIQDSGAGCGGRNKRRRSGQTMMRVLALDVGDKRIGIAVSDPLGITAQGLETYNRTGDIEKDAEYIANFAKKYVPVRLLFGMPRNMDGSYGFQSEKVKEFADAVLKLWDGEHAFFDERLTTVSAERVLMEAELDWRKRRKVVDKLAATIILQGYLDSNPRL